MVKIKTAQWLYGKISQIRNGSNLPRPHSFDICVDTLSHNTQMVEVLNEVPMK